MAYLVAFSHKNQHFLIFIVSYYMILYGVFLALSCYYLSAITLFGVESYNGFGGFLKIFAECRVYNY